MKYPVWKEVLKMWYWIAAFFVCLVVFEEAIYYSWNRYLYGKKKKPFKERKWRKVTRFLFLKWKQWTAKDVQA
jgi:hypothetical protein